MQIEVIDTVERLVQIELNWDELYRRDPHAHFYLSSQFLICVAMRAEGKFRILAAWSDDGRCLGLLPMIVTIRWSKSNHCLYNVLDMLGHVFDADYTGILCDPSSEKEVCRAFAQEISGMPFGRIILNYVSGPADRLDAFISAFDPAVFDTKHKEQFINDGQTNNLICPYIDLPDQFPRYLAALSSNMRQKLRRLLRQLESDPSLKVTRSRPETYTRDITILADLWYRKHVDGKGQKRAAHLADLFKEAIMLGLASGNVYLAIIWRGDTPIAAQANYIDLVKRQALFHVGGRDESVRDFSAGLMLQAHCIRWSIANGLKRYDFTIGNEPYKHSLGGIDRHIASAEVFTKAGGNVTQKLDENARDDVLKIIRAFVRKARSQDAVIAASQALATWPDLESTGDVKALIANISSRPSQGTG
ncbi:MAG: GNAT family N-acetyltransferase [Pseudomonadota bacterium]